MTTTVFGAGASSPFIAQYITMRYSAYFSYLEDLFLKSFYKWYKPHALPDNLHQESLKTLWNYRLVSVLPAKLKILLMPAKY